MLMVLMVVMEEMVKIHTGVGGADVSDSIDGEGYTLVLVVLMLLVV